MNSMKPCNAQIPKKVVEEKTKGSQQKPPLTRITKIQNVLTSELHHAVHAKRHIWFHALITAFTFNSSPIFCSLCLRGKIIGMQAFNLWMHFNKPFLNSAPVTFTV